jgi:hypothetical protein
VVPENGAAVAFASTRSSATAQNPQAGTGPATAPGTLSRRSFEVIGSISNLFRRVEKPGQTTSSLSAPGADAPQDPRRVAMP